MAITSWPRVNEDTTDTQYAEFFNSIIGTGVRDTGSLAVSADSSGLNVKVATGFAVVAGTAFLSTAVETLTVPANTGTLARVDTVILQRNFAAAAGQTIRLLIKQGTTIAPSLTQSVTGVYEYPLANITVAPAAATITTANLADRRTYLSERVGIWTTATRPSARVGRVGFNTTTGTLEAHNGSGWVYVETPWASVTGKPSTFPPSTHGHALTDANITGTLPVNQGGTGATTPANARANLEAAAASHSHSWGEVTGKPTTFPPSSHTHSTDQLTSGTLPLGRGGTGATSASTARANIGAAAASHTHDWDEVTGKPSSFPPSAHNHSATQITSGTLPISRGGTGASNASDALEAMGIFVQSSAPGHASGRVWIKTA
ncbi:minor tail protein [Microbacterium phage Floof]|uniref:Minor tail protein n=1 Tax=Microbacterium phage Floof TaxID=2201433 RepID=A0A2Z4Q4C9_9CAUD|nr:minor tail protein [Microbacterium phage Floof]